MADLALSEAIVLYFGWGTAPWPQRRSEAVVKRFGESMRESCAAFQREVMAVTPDWSVTTYHDACAKARARVAEAYPQLTDAALDALEWEFSYEWK